MANYNFRQPFWPKGLGVAILMLVWHVGDQTH